MSPFIKRHAAWVLPILCLLLITPFSAELDLFVSKSVFFRETEEGFFSTPFFDWIYLYGVMPAQILGVLATLCLILSLWMQKLKPFRKPCLLLSLTLIIGSGLITHTMLKEFWGRPRPRQIVDFGGKQPFRPYYEPLFNKTPEPFRSFPCGHSTCGFYFFSVYFLAKRFRFSRIATGAFLFSLLLGGLLSIARIVQGGHFFTDVLIAGLIMWLTAYFVDLLIYAKEPEYSAVKT